MYLKNGAPNAIEIINNPISSEIEVFDYWNATLSEKYSKGYSKLE